MTLKEPQCYTLTPQSDRRYHLQGEMGIKTSFSGLAAMGGVPKLYTLSQAGRLIYVGIALRSMAARLNHGLKAVGKGGYHGYKWKNLREPLRLVVWTLNWGARPVALKDLETIEAEVAHLCRLESKQWPEYQHEIHFHPSTDMHREAAKRIYTLALTQ